MIFELGKTYIVDVTEKGIIPLMEFDEDRWYDKDHDDLDFLTDEEKDLVINTVLNKIRAEIPKLACCENEYRQALIKVADVIKCIDNYRAESEG